MTGKTDNSYAGCKPFYFSAFEDRIPDAPLKTCVVREFVWQILAMATIGLGAWYIYWRWTASLNNDAMVFSVLVATAETLSFIGLLLYFNNLWSVNDVPRQSTPKRRSDVVGDGAERVLSVDVFIPTFTEDPEMTRYSIRDAKRLSYPYDIEINVYVLDDGNRAEMRAVAEQEGVNYITRNSNVGFKAGNLRNALEQTSGDFLVILDSDTRPFPTLLENTLGYFRDPEVAWVQTPQWFYDIPQGRKLDQVMSQSFGRVGGICGKLVQRIVGPIKWGEDPFVSDPKLFYDVILRRRNRANASFCCGAGSVHRREAVMEAALKSYSIHISNTVNGYLKDHEQGNVRTELEDCLRRHFSIKTEFTPYKFHVSEDIYTSMILQSDPDRTWKSVLHPNVETKMLSPLDMKSWAMQRFKYAGGTLDIMAHDNPLFRKGMSVGQKLMYAMTFWSYLSPLWVLGFIAAPIVSMATGLTPVSAYSAAFFMHLLPFLLVHELATVVGTWGVDNSKGRKLNIAFFSFNLQALWSVFRGREIKFEVTPKQRNTENYIYMVWPQIGVVVLTVLAFLIACVRQYIDPNPSQLASLMVNGFWGFTNACAMSVLIFAALWKPETVDDLSIDVKNRRNFARIS